MTPESTYSPELTFVLFIATLLVGVVLGYALRRFVVWLYCILAMVFLCGTTYGAMVAGAPVVPFFIAFGLPGGVLLGSLTRAKPRR